MVNIRIVGDENSDPCPSSPPSPLTCPPSLLNFSHVNVNSITSDCRLDELSQHTSTHNIDVLCATETKLDAKFTLPFMSLTIFTHLLLSTVTGMEVKSEVAIYVKDSIPTKRLPDLEVGDFELI